MGFAASKNVAVRFGVIVLLEFRDVITGRAASVPVEFRVIPTEVDTGGTILLGATRSVQNAWTSTPLTSIMSLEGSVPCVVKELKRH